MGDSDDHRASKTKIWQEQINEGDKHVDGMRFAGHWPDYLGVFDVENPDYADYMHARYYDPRGGFYPSIPAMTWT